MSGVINKLIRELVTELGVTAITITHDMSSVRMIADSVTMLHAGRCSGAAVLRIWKILAVRIWNNFYRGRQRDR